MLIPCLLLLVPAMNPYWCCQAHMSASRRREIPWWFGNDTVPFHGERMEIKGPRDEL